jgi:hypothetical protein
LSAPISQQETVSAAATFVVVEVLVVEKCSVSVVSVVTVDVAEVDVAVVVMADVVGATSQLMPVKPPAHVQLATLKLFPHVPWAPQSTVRHGSGASVVVSRALPF